MIHYTYLIKNVIIPLTDIVTGYSFYSSLNFLEKSQYLDSYTITNYQDRLLIKLFTEANYNTKYYKELFKKINFNVNEIKSQKDLKYIPILTKNIIQENGIEAFTNKSINRRNFLLRSSSGSTGEPLFYYLTKKAYSMDIAANVRGWQWMGYNIGDKFIKLSQNPRNKVLKKIQDKLIRNHYTAVSPINNERFAIILNNIAKTRPKYLRGYPDPLLLFSRYLREKNFIENLSIKGINTTGNTLFKEVRDEIEKVFNLKIFDSYSCEGTPTVFECNSHNHYHIADEYGIVEVLDNNNNPISSGVGRLISTDLWNYAHPFIRYETQDLVEVSKEMCLNGIQLTQIKKIIGRSNDVIILKNGTYLIVHNFTGFFQTDCIELKRSILKFQVINRGDGIVFNLVVNANYDSTVESFIVNYWEKIADCKILCNVVDNIELTKSGKHRFIINQK